MRDQCTTLANLYNSSDDPDIDELGDATLEKLNVYFPDIEKHEPQKELIVLKPKDCASFIHFINDQYRKARNKNEKSGTHDDFHMFVGNKSWIYYYHLRLLEQGNTDYSAIAYADLNPDVFFSSSSLGTSYDSKRKIDDKNKNEA